MCVCVWKLQCVSSVSFTTWAAFTSDLTRSAWADPQKTTLISKLEPIHFENQTYCWSLDLVNLNKPNTAPLSVWICSLLLLQFSSWGFLWDGWDGLPSLVEETILQFFLAYIKIVCKAVPLPMTLQFLFYLKTAMISEYLASKNCSSISMTACKIYIKNYHWDVFQVEYPSQDLLLPHRMLLLGLNTTCHTVHRNFIQIFVKSILNTRKGLLTRPWSQHK